jgi:hypothetical protein
MSEWNKQNPQGGMYHTPLGRFRFNDAINYYSHAILNTWCHNPNKIITIHSLRQLKNFPKDWEGKTRKEVGFWYEI